MKMKKTQGLGEKASKNDLLTLLSKHCDVSQPWFYPQHTVYVQQASGNSTVTTSAIPA
jgi:hypothetical protein